MNRDRWHAGHAAGRRPDVDVDGVQVGVDRVNDVIAAVTLQTP